MKFSSFHFVAVAALCLSAQAFVPANVRKSSLFKKVNLSASKSSENSEGLASMQGLKHLAVAAAFTLTLLSAPGPSFADGR